MDRIYKLAKEFGSLYTEKVNGFFMGKVIVNIYGEYEESTAIVRSEITKDGQLYKRCAAYIEDKDTKCISYNITLMRPRNISKAKGDYIFKDSRKEEIIRINNKEVEEFIDITGDKNFI